MSNIVLTKDGTTTTISAGQKVYYKGTQLANIYFRANPSAEYTKVWQYDVVAPVLTIYTPLGTSESSPTVRRSASFTIKGKVTDADSGVEALMIWVDHDGYMLESEEDGSWSLDLTLSTEVSEITITATDYAGNSVTETRYAVYCKSKNATGSVSVDNYSALESWTTTTIKCPYAGTVRIRGSATNAVGKDNSGVWYASKDVTVTLSKGQTYSYYWGASIAGSAESGSATVTLTYTPKETD